MVVDNSADVLSRLSRLSLQPESSGGGEGAGFSLRAGEVLMREQGAVGLQVGDATASGKLALTSQRVLFVPEAGGGATVSVDLLSVVIHAQSSASEGRGGGIYLQVEVKPEAAEWGLAGAAEEGPEDGIETIELSLVPEDQASLGPLFDAFCECVAMNPDEGYLEEEDGEEEEGAPGFEVREAPREATERDDLNELLDGNPDRFADA
mmetsp:Transcript_1869/g.4297  ORF Transcript_1869/g.4297 Transcript_1869/m.4297 type:complete len:207 (-) Transcript_1869:602-1222(-)